MAGLEEVVDQRIENEDLYLVQLPDLTAVIKPLALKRAQAYRRLIGDSEDPTLILDLEEAIARECAVDLDPPIDLSDPSLVEQTKVGLISTIARLCLRISMAQSLDEINLRLQLTRPLAQTPESQLKILICKVFSYKFEELDSWTWERILLRAAQAEVVLSGAIDQLQVPITFALETNDRDLKRPINRKRENLAALAEAEITPPRRGS